MTTYASYLPESQIITLRKDFPAFTDPEKLDGFINPEQFGVFFMSGFIFFIIFPQLMDFLFLHAKHPVV